MDPLELQYDTPDTIPEAFRPLYTEKDGKHVLTGVKGMKTQADIDRLTGALTKERNDHKTVRTQFEWAKDLKPEEVLAKLGEYDELKLAAEGKVDKAKLDEMVEARLNAKVTPLERERQTLTQQLQERDAKLQELNNAIVSRDIRDAVRTSAITAKVVDTALEDVLLIAGSVFEKTEDGQIVTKDTGLDAAAWIADMKEKRPHWWPSANGADAHGGKGGGAGDNPWSATNWNVTKQGQIIREKGLPYAQNLAKSAGSMVGAAHPTVVKK